MSHLMPSLDVTNARRAASWLAAVVCALTPVPAPLAAQDDAGAVLDRAVAAFGRVTTLRASFVQTLLDPMLGDATSRGELFQQRPDKFAMRWSQPRGDLLLADGSFLWVYLPSSTPGQVVKSAITGRPGSSPDVIAEFLERPRERFNVAYVRAQAVGGRPADVLSFTPRQRGGPYSRVLLWIDRGDDLPHQVEITEASGATRRITLDRLRVNTAIPASTFTFRPPAGVRVVDASN